MIFSSSVYPIQWNIEDEDWRLGGGELAFQGPLPTDMPNSDPSAHLASHEIDAAGYKTAGRENDP